MKNKRGRAIAVFLVLLLPLLLCSCSKNEYTVTFDSRGGSEVTDVVKIGAWVKKANFPTPEREGYIFDGWFTDIYCTMPATLTNIRQNALQEITLYAKWKGVEHTLSFDANSGSGSMAPVIIRSGDAALLPENEFTKFGYLFEGWATTADGEAEYADHSSYTMGISGHPTLYAVWVFDYNFYTKSFFTGRIEQLIEIYQIEDIDPEDCVLDTPEKIAAFTEIFDAPALIDKIDLLVNWLDQSTVFCMKEEIYAESFKDAVVETLNELNEILEEPVVFSYEIRGNLVALTIGGGANLLIDEITE